MTDWADEIAEELFLSLTQKEAEEDGTPFCNRIATALRKAKAEGMRDAAQFVKNEAQGDCDYAEFCLSTRANAIEKGTE